MIDELPMRVNRRESNPPAQDARAAIGHFQHCARHWAIAPRTYPRGVFKFRLLAEAQAARAQVAERQLIAPDHSR